MFKCKPSNSLLPLYPRAGISRGRHQAIRKVQMTSYDSKYSYAKSSRMDDGIVYKRQMSPFDSVFDTMPLFPVFL